MKLTQEIKLHKKRKKKNNEEKCFGEANVFTRFTQLLFDTQTCIRANLRESIKVTLGKLEGNMHRSSRVMEVINHGIGLLK